ncbi:sugar phosphate isomerase/epimerase [Fusobacterium mortiferum]|uniref:sugar phosphate isomerase/epimerase family protein n=1 Tax=Fusobacterium mortiferum TaxID=850 RepID=UPI00195E03A5|nr:sugar phosphate isomerase/epimerase [Fusobacterium mortiferum]
MNNIFVSDLICANNSIEESKKFFIENNIKNIEFFIENQDIEHSKKLESLLEGLELEKISFHASYRYFLLTCSEEKWSLMEQDFKKSIEICKKYHGDFLVLHTNEGINNIYLDKKILEERILKLVKLGKDNGIKIVIENVGVGENMLYNQEEYIKLIQKYNFYSLIDIGHAIANKWSIPHIITELKENILAYHFHNNNGESDLHNPIKDGIANFEEIMLLVKEYTPRANIVLEYSAITPKKEILNTLNILK